MLVLLAVVVAVVARGDLFQPLFVLQIPVHGLSEALLEGDGGRPSQLRHELARVDGVAGVVAGAVFHKGDQLPRRALLPAQPLVHHVAQKLDEVDVAPLVHAPHVVGLPHSAPVEDRVDGPRVVLDVEPVPHVLPLPVHGHGPSLLDVVDGQRDELLGEVVGAVVVRAVAQFHRQPVGVEPRPHEVVRGGLGGRVGRARVVGRGLGEEPLLAQRAVHLVGGDVVEEFALKVPRPSAAAGLQQVDRADDVGLNEGHGPGDGAVHVRLSRQMEHRPEPVLGENRLQIGRISDVALEEGVVLPPLHIRKVLQVARVGELIEVEDVIVRVGLHKQPHHVRADEAGPAGNQ